MDKTFSLLGHDVSIAPRQEADMGIPTSGIDMPQALPVGQKEIEKAISTLTDYKNGKSNLESRVVEDELWYQLRHQEVIRRKREMAGPEPTSAWLFDALNNKHADAMDNYPEPNVLPRERGDEEDAKILSAVLPVIIERNGFEQTYSDNWWEKLKHGTAPYGVFWNPELENGLGDIDIHKIDLLNIFWEPGVSDIQKSRNLFIVDTVDKDLLEEQYPEHTGKLDGSVVDIKQYIYDDTVQTQDKVVVVDWYYKRRSPDGRTLLHYAKFVGSTLLFASENDERYAQGGWYAHGKYPVVFDTLFPEKGTPVGFGYVAITKDPQLYIDKLGGNILKNSIMATEPRYMVSSTTGVNEEEFADWTKPFVHVEGGSLDDAKIRPVEVKQLGNIYVDVLQMKINELKETSSNRDYNNGGTASGVTAAAAIAALQEAGNKTSRDMIAAAYRSYTQVNYLCIELVRQFYDESRSFRITGQGGAGFEYVQMDNSRLSGEMMPPAYPGQELEPGYEASVRVPVFDISIKPQKRNPFSRMSQNELAKELYALGVFNPERAQEVLGMLEMMEFEGKDKVLEQVRQGQTLLNVCQQMSQQLDQMAAIIQGLTGQPMGMEGTMAGPQATPAPGGAVPNGKTVERAATNAQRQGMTSYGERLASRATPDMSQASGNVMQG